MSVATASPWEQEQRTFIVEVYRWMTVGLAVTGGVALFMAARPQLIRQMMSTPVLFYVLLGVELGAVFVLAAWVHRMSSAAAMGIFLAYAALNGLTLSVIFLVYTRASIANAFFVTAGTFGAMSGYGYVTKTDLTSVGNIAFMALIGLILASVVNFFLRSPMFDLFTAYAGVLIFTALTAYDTQKIKGMIRPSDEGTEEETKDAISGALALYLDFVNIFLDLLRIMGKRNND